MGKPRTEEDKAKIRAGWARRKAAGLPCGRTKTGKYAPKPELCDKP